MTKTLKEKVTMSIAILLAVILLFQSGITTSKAEANGVSSPTVEEISQVLDDYMESKGLNIKKGTSAYLQFLISIEADKEIGVKSLPEYNDIKTYASYYLVFSEGITSEELLEIPLQMKNKKLEVLKIESAIKEKFHKELEKNNSYSKATFKASVYNPADAVSYAKKWAEKRNPNYLKFDLNCTNFVSQAVLAGGKGMKMPTNICQIGKKNITSVYWYNKKALSCGGGVSNREIEGYSTALTTVADFHTYWMNTRKGEATTASYTNISTLQNNLKLGDIVQLHNGDE